MKDEGVDLPVIQSSLTWDYVKMKFSDPDWFLKRSLTDTCRFSDAGRVLLTLDICGVHDATGLLKQYLRELPDPVIPGHMYRAFIAAGCKLLGSLINDRKQWSGGLNEEK